MAMQKRAAKELKERERLKKQLEKVKPAIIAGVAQYYPAERARTDSAFAAAER